LAAVLEIPLLCLGLFWERWKRRPAPELLEASKGPVIVSAVWLFRLKEITEVGGGFISRSLGTQLLVHEREVV
jgi:hypothetical protein